MRISESKVVVITGASSGFGKATAERLAANGYTVLCGARRLDRLEELARQLNTSSTMRVYYQILDVTSPKSVEDFYEWATTKFLRIDVLVNNAGLALSREPVASGSPQEWSTMWETNVQGLMYVTQQFLRVFHQQHHGHIVNIGSISGEEVYAGGAAYCATKFAVKALTKSLRLETLGQNIRVSSIDPGMAETEFSLVRFQGDTATAKKVYEGVKPLAADDVAAAVEYVISAPAHVNIDSIRLTPIQQADAAHIFRKT